MLEEQRVIQVQQKKDEYHWYAFPDLGYPSALDPKHSIPLDQRFDRVKNIDFIENLVEGGVEADGNSIWMKMKNIFERSSVSHEELETDSMYSLHNFYTIAKGLIDKSSKHLMEKNNQEMLIMYETYRFVSNADFGIQILNGVNCVVVKKCMKLPDNFPVTNEMVIPFLNFGQTLDTAMKASLLIHTYNSCINVRAHSHSIYCVIALKYQLYEIRLFLLKRARNFP